jgi:hypothetical protein
MVSKSHTVAIDGLRVTASWIGASWGVLCHEEDCSASIIGFRGERPALLGGMAHLIWHVNGKPTCQACGAWLNYRSARLCRQGTCEVER